MKKLLLLIYILFGIISCVKVEYAEEPSNKQITFSFASNKTKASIDDNTIPDGTYFGAYGYVISNGDYSNKYFIIKNGEFNSQGTSSHKYFWPYTGPNTNLQSTFVAYYPYKSTGITESDGVLTIPVNMSTNQEVLYAVAYNSHPVAVGENKANVDLFFNHALATLRYQCRFLTSYYVWAELENFRFKSNVYTSANLLIDEIGDKGWDNNITWNSFESASDLSYDTKLILDTTYTEAVDLLLLPQKSPDSLRIVVNLNVTDSSQTLEYKGRVIDIEMPIDTFESGKKYTLKQTLPIYNINFDLIDNWVNPHDTAWQSWAHIPNAEANHYFYQNFSPNAAKFSNQVIGLDYPNGDYIEAKIDLSKLNKARQNIFSMGEDIANWSPSGSVEKFNFHVYFPNDVGDKRLRFSIVSNNKVNNNTRRTMGIVKPDIFTFDPDTSYIVTVRFDKDGFYVNGHLITRDDFDPVEASKTPEWPKNPSGVYPDVWTYPDYFMPHFNVGPLNIQFGSMEGSSRSYADYIYIMYHHIIN